MKDLLSKMGVPVERSCPKCGYSRQCKPEDVACPICKTPYLLNEGEDPTKSQGNANNAASDAVEKKGANRKITKCKACKKEVSVTAKSCPHCGEKDPGTVINEKVVGLIGLIAFAFLIYTLEFSGSDQPKTKDNDLSVDAFLSCKKAVRAQAKYGSKADFAWRFDQHRNGNIVTVYGKVDLLNALGAKLPYKYACDVNVVTNRVSNTLISPD